MSLRPGARLGIYEIVAEIGAGGMGEVYQARDTRLQRDVALKILPPVFQLDRDRIARFDREAQLLASLNHPNIAHIYGIEEASGAGQDGTRALVMELVPGRTLAEIIEASATGLPVGEALSLARQIAEALETAHDKGIIHRDLKPANVMITPDGHVKLLDFGLGKALENDQSDVLNSPTMTAGTLAGVILGTAAYMAPEQAKGRAADRRSDVWAFGCVLYEMLAGRRAFEGDGVSDTLAGILRGEPDWGALPPEVPPHVRQVLRRCLNKDRKLRLHDIGDARLELDETGAAVGPMVPSATPVPESRLRERLISLGIAVGLSAIVGTAVWWLRTPGLGDETRLEISTPQSNDLVSFALSPDGRQMTFVATSGGQSMLWLRALDATSSAPLPGTEGAAVPFWSPDSQSIGFVAGTKLKRFDLTGRVVRSITDASPGSPGAWSGSGVILYRRPGNVELFRITASAGGAAAQVTNVADNGVALYQQPQFLPDGNHFICFGTGSPDVRGIYLGALDRPGLKRLTRADSGARYLVPGWLLFGRQGALVARRFDLTRESLAEEEVLIAEGLGDGVTPAVSVSAEGIIAYRTGTSVRRQLMWFDRTGGPSGAIGQADDTLLAPELSPDGKRVVVSRVVQGNRDIYVIDAQHETRLTFDPATDTFPLWSPDGTRIAFNSLRQGATGEFVRLSTGAGGEEMLATASPPTVYNGATSWSHDGRFLLFDVNSPTSDVWVLPLGVDRKPYPFLNSTAAERLALFSPNGRWVAYQSNEAGRAQIYIRPFPGPGGQWQVSTAGGAQPRWRTDGKELYFIAPDGGLMSAQIAENGDSIDHSTPVKLFQTRIYLAGSEQPLRGQYNVAKDGKFLINTVVDEGPVPPIVVLQNWRPK